MVVASTLPVFAANNTNEGGFVEVPKESDNILSGMPDLVPGIQSTAQVIIRNTHPQIREFFLLARDAESGDFTSTAEQDLSDDILSLVHMEVHYYPVDQDGTIRKDLGQMLYRGTANGHTGDGTASGAKTDSLSREPILLTHILPGMTGAFVITMDVSEDIDKATYEYATAKFRWDIVAATMPMGPITSEPEADRNNQKDRVEDRLHVLNSEASSVDASDITVLDHSQMPDKVPDHLLPQTGGGRIPEQMGTLAPILVFILIALIGLLVLKGIEAKKKVNKDK